MRLIHRGSRFVAVMTLGALALAAGPAMAATRTAQLAPFREVDVTGNLIVTIDTTHAAPAVLEGAADDLDRVTFDMGGEQLSVRLAPPVLGEQGQRAPIRVTLHAHDLDAVALRGAGMLSVGPLRGDHVRVTLAGAGVLNVASIDADHVAIDNIGSGRIAIAGGHGGLVQLLQQGTGAIAAAAFTAQAVDISQDGPATIDVTASDRVSVRANGAGSVTVRGQADCSILGDSDATIRCGRDPGSHRPD